MPYTIAIGNQKGGVAKSTTAVNLSAALIRVNKGPKKFKVLLIDLDPQSNATMTVFPDDRNDYKKVSSIIDIFNGEPLRDSIIPTNIPNLDLIPSKLSLFSLEKEIKDNPRPLELLRAALDREPFIQKYDYIIIDCPPNLGCFMLNGFVAATHYMVPVQSESSYSLDGLSNLEDTIKGIKSVCNKDLNFLGYLITMYDGRTLTGKMMKESIEISLKDSLFKTVIRRNTDINKALCAKQTIFQYDLRVNGSIDYLCLAKEVVEKTGFNEE